MTLPLYAVIGMEVVLVLLAGWCCCVYKVCCSSPQYDTFTNEDGIV